MRFIGNKEQLLNQIYSILKKEGVEGNSFFDFFSGTANVGKFFKKLGYQVYSSDILFFSYCLQKAYLENNQQPLFEKVDITIKEKQNHIFKNKFQEIIEFLNQIEPIKGFIYNNYAVGGTNKLKIPRMYFSDKNAQRIDAIRQQIEHWNKEGLLLEEEYFILLASLIESVGFYSNISGVYAAFQKKWDPRALKDFQIKPVEIIIGKYVGTTYNKDSLSLLNDIDANILYIDPPYNERQYAPNYHILETIARYDNPKITGITGMRDYKQQKSSFCNKSTALRDLDKIAKIAKYKYLLLSYNNEGIMPQEDIVSILKKYGSVKVVEFEYARFKSNSNGGSKTKKHIKEQLYILKKSEVN